MQIYDKIAVMIVVIVNPEAGKGRAQRVLGLVCDVFDRQGASYEVWFTRRPGHATELARKAVEEGCERVISVGGDGTVREIAQGLVGTGCPLGIIPAGTGNDYGKTVGLSPDIETAAQDALAPHMRDVDVIDMNGAICINIASVGLDAEAVYNASKFKRVLRGLPAYLAGFLLGFIRYKPVRLRLRVDGGEEQDMQKTIFVIANGRYYGGGFQPVPEAEVDNGRIELMHAQPLKRLELLGLLGRFARGKHAGHPAVAFSSCQTLEIKLPKPTHLNVDGEIWDVEQMEFSLRRAALRLVAKETVCKS